MNYIWEALLQAKKNGIEERDLRYKAAENPSPYIEVSFCDLNTSSLDDNVIALNPLYRFADVFAGVLDRNLKGYEKTREIFLDIVFHYIAHTDLYMGLQKQEYYLQILLKEMDRGIYGKKIKDALDLFDREEKRVIVRALIDTYRSGNYLRIFTKIVEDFYHHTIVYASRDRANELMIYLGIEENETDKRKINFLADTFLPISYKVHIYFALHFGVVDVDETMVLERILLI